MATEAVFANPDPRDPENWPGRIVAIRSKRLVTALLYSAQTWDEAEPIMRDLASVFRKPNSYQYTCAVLREMKHNASRADVAMISICLWIVENVRRYGIAPTFASLEHPKAHYRGGSGKPTHKLSPPPPPPSD